GANRNQWHPVSDDVTEELKKAEHERQHQKCRENHHKVCHELPQHVVVEDLWPTGSKVSLFCSPTLEGSFHTLAMAADETLLHRFPNGPQVDDVDAGTVHAA